MRVLDEIDGFFARKRRWPLVLLALVLAGIGHLLAGQTAQGLVADGRALTRNIAAQLHAVQPFAIADRYQAETANRRGLWFCSTADERDAARNAAFARAYAAGEPFYQIMGRDLSAPVPGKTDCTQGWLVFGRGMITNVMASPAVGVGLWREGGWVNRLFFPLTLIGMAAILIAMWREPGGTPIIQTAAVLTAGPLIMGALFWLALWALLALIWLFGAVLAGAAWLIATFAGVYKVCAFCIGVLKSSDELAHHGALAADTVQDLKAPPPDPPR